MSARPARLTAFIAGAALLFTTLVVPAQASTSDPDVEAPVVTSFSVTASSQSLDEGDVTVTATATITDESSVVPPKITASNAASGEEYVSDPATLISGSEYAGEWSIVVVIPSTATPGDWTITLKPLEDLLGNQGGTATTPQSVTLTRSFSTAPTPTISGSAIVGKTLTAKAGTWSPTATLKYQWLRDGKAISGATKTTYKLTSSDLGKKIQVRVTGSKSGYPTTAKTSASVTAVKPFTKAPAPKISGSAIVGKTLTAKAGTWSPAATLKYQWLRDGKAISGATKTTYKLTSSDATKKIQVRVTASKSGYATTAKTSASVTAKGIFTKAPTPTTSGSAKVGTTLTAKAGTWSPTATLKYQWLRDGKAISGATKTTYKLTSSDLGKKIQVRVTASKSGYVTTAKTSKATAKVSYPSRTTPSGSTCPSWAPIKGNASSMIYHVPGGAYYSKTKPEECFSTRAAAEAAGYRASKR